MPSIKVMDLVAGENRRRELWNCIGRFNLKAWSIQQAPGIFYIVTEDTEYESYFRDEVVGRFAFGGFELILPAEYHSLKTIIIRQLDIEYCNKTTREFADTIKVQNSWTQVEGVTSLPCKSPQRMIKVNLGSWRQAQRAMNEGIRVFDQTIPPKYIEQEVFTRIVSCSNCHCYEHYEKDCRKPKTKKMHHMWRRGPFQVAMPEDRRLLLELWGQGPPAL